ncbi:hypothetical protein IWW56_002327 [Coemansia sp. RSA 2131]|nr:hypothetical protein IWW56_002327 [Coemansia sp. RSA 2131]
MYGHRRERSSLSTTCSQSSGHSRVLPFATARTLQAPGHMEAIAETPDTHMYISDNHRFALAQPRRVITQPATFGHRVQPKRHSASIGISTLLTEKSRHATRVRPIIGLGLTLNPADALVRLQPRRSTHTHSAESSRSSIVLSEAFAYASPALESCASLADLSPRYTDPQIVHTCNVKRNVCKQSEQMAVASWQSSPDDSESEARVPSVRSEPSSRELSRKRGPTSVCCLLCFEHVRVAPHSKSTKCPACNSTLRIRSTL